MKYGKEHIITLPNTHLRQRSKKIGLIDDKVQQLIEHMKTATLDWEDSREHEIGVALAAIQIDQPLRVVVIRSNFNNKSDRTFRVFINPEITKYEGKLVKDYEGCLSIKDVYGYVERSEQIRVKALDADGKAIRIKAEGFLARIFQHEIDHTNGVVFIDHIKEEPEAFFKLDEQGNLKALDYEKDVRNNRILW